MGGDVTRYCILHLTLHVVAEQLGGLLRILQLSRLADLIESLAGYGPERLSVKVRVSLLDDAGIYAGYCHRSTVHQPRNCPVDLLLLEVDESFLVCGNLAEMKQMLLSVFDVPESTRLANVAGWVAHEMIPAPSAVAAPGGQPSPCQLAQISKCQDMLLPVRACHPCDHARYDALAGFRTGCARLRAARARAVRRPQAQDNCHLARRRVAADLRDRDRLRGRRPELRVDAQRAQGRGSPPGSAVRPAQRHG